MSDFLMLKLGIPCCCCWPWLLATITSGFFPAGIAGFGPVGAGTDMLEPSRLTQRWGTGGLRSVPERLSD